MDLTLTATWNRIRQNKPTGTGVQKSQRPGRRERRETGAQQVQKLTILESWSEFRGGSGIAARGAACYDYVVG